MEWGYNSTKITSASTDSSSFASRQASCSNIGLSWIPKFVWDNMVI